MNTGIKRLRLSLPLYLTLVVFGATTASAQVLPNNYEAETCGTYDYTWRDGTHTAYELQSGGTLGQSFSALTSFDRLEVSTPNYADGEGGYTLSLYRWDDASGSYQVSVSQPPIARKTFERIVDNSWVELDFAAQPPGNYVWEVSGKIGNSIGVWGFSGSSYFGGAFRNGSLSGMSGVDFASRFMLRCPESPTPTPTSVLSPTPSANCGTYDYSWRDGTHTAYELPSGGTLGQSFSAMTSFDRLEVSTPNYADGEGGYTLSLYRWDDASGSYQVSVGQPPIARRSFAWILDNSWADLNFAPQPPGNYVWEISGKVGNSIGVWGFSGSTYFGGAFRNGSLSGMSGVDFASRFLLRCPESPTPLQVVYDGVILVTGSHSYAPAHLFDPATGTHRMWWTDWDAAASGRDAIWYSERTGSLKQTTAGWTRPVMAASKDRIGTWVVNHVADASVIMGQFPYGASTYRYGLFFTSDDGGGSYGNRIGVAFSNNPADFRVAHPQPVISSDYPPNGGYGAGTSGVAWDPKGNQYVHAYIDSSNGNRIRIKRSGDLINWVPTPSLNTGLSDAGRGQGQGPDIAYNLSDGHWYAVVKAPDADGTYDGMVRVLRSRNADDYLGDWEVLAEIGRATTGNRGNHNPGLGKTGEGGYLYLEDGWMYVFFGTGTGWDGGDQIAIAQARVYIGHLLSPGPSATPAPTQAKTATPVASAIATSTRASTSNPTSAPSPTLAKTATPAASQTAIATSTAAATAIPGQTFVDVPAGHWAHDYIESLYQGMFVAGCSDAPRMFCPENSMARVEAAVFVVRGVHIEEVRNAYPLSWAPPQPTADPFADVAKGTWFAKWVNQLKEDRYTAGCGKDASGNPLFCPLLAHTRAEATVFFLRMLNGPDFSPPLDPTRPQVYDDVPVDPAIWYTQWVYAAYDAGLIQACEDPSNRGDRLFRPMADITRAEAACMMATAVGAIPPTPTPIPSPTTPASTPTPIPTTSPSPPPYPTPSIMKIKSITVEDYWLPPSIASWGAGSITVNFFWPSGCNSENCTPIIPPQAAQSMSDFYARDPTLRVTAIIFGVPVWARSNPTCLTGDPNDFANAACAPRKDALDELARFAGNVASTYDGNGKFLIQDFVIMNEVNHSYWFNNYCGVGSNLCDVNAWVRAYADVYVPAYDAILAIRPNARVMVPLDNHFDKYYDSASNWPDSYDIISGMTFLEKFNQELVTRGHSSRLMWTLAYHAYPPDMRLPEFTAYDLPKVTFGNIGVVMGWLGKTFPGQRASSEMQLTENGINALSPSSAEYQAAWLCKAFRNVLGTPGITSFSYHRFKDHPAEVYGYGLFDSASVPRLSWSDWKAVNSGAGYCGFENPTLAERFIPLKRGYNPVSGLHWISSRLLPQGFHEEQAWNLLRYPEAGTVMLYECQISSHTFLSTDVGCENQQVMGPVGYAYTTQRANTVPIYRCLLANGRDHLFTSSATCEGISGAVLENGGMPLGYAAPAAINATLRRGYRAGVGHWAGSTLPAGFTEEKSWALLSTAHAQLPTVALYSCQLGGHSFLSTDANCEGQVKLGLVGRAYTERQPGTIPIYRCRLGNGQDHLITSDATCEGWTMEPSGQPLGYAEPLGWWYGPGGLSSMFLNPP